MSRGFEEESFPTKHVSDFSAPVDEKSLIRMVNLGRHSGHVAQLCYIPYLGRCLPTGSDYCSSLGWPLGARVVPGLVYSAWLGKSFYLWGSFSSTISVRGS